MWEDIYANDPIAQLKAQRNAPKKQVTLSKNLILEHTLTEFCGAVVSATHAFVRLEDFSGFVREFPLSDGFLLEGEPVALKLPTKKLSNSRTASGSFAAPKQRAKVAQASRIFVEGRHDAELIEAVWGDDLRDSAIVVEILDGADNLAACLTDFAPTSSRRAGVLLDHLLPGTKEFRLVAQAVKPEWQSWVRVTGHPYVDVWQAIKPARLGLQNWPDIPRNEDWKTGILKRLGIPYAEQQDIAAGWQQILRRVRDYRDIEPQLVGSVESLIDFVTVGV